MENENLIKHINDACAAKKSRGKHAHIHIFYKQTIHFIHVYISFSEEQNRLTKCIFKALYPYFNRQEEKKILTTPVYGEFDRLKNSIKEDFNGHKIQKRMTGFFLCKNKVFLKRMMNIKTKGSMGL